MPRARVAAAFLLGGAVMGKPVDMERRRKVWDYATQHPDLSGDEIAIALNLRPRTVYADVAAAETTVNERAASAMRAAIVSRNLQMIEGLLPKALAGNVRSVEGVLACHDEIRKLYGLDAPKEARLTIELREAVERIAPLYGLETSDLFEDIRQHLHDTQAIDA